MRRVWIVLGLIGGLVLLTMPWALAANVPWLSVTPFFGRPGDNVVFTVTGTPGDDAALAYSFSNLGAGQLNGQNILLGPDFSVFASGTIGPGGAFTASVTIPPGLLGDVLLQAGVSPPGSPTITLTNGITLYVMPAGEGGIGVADLTLTKFYGCGSPTAAGIDFNAVVGALTPIREATMQVPTTPTPTVYRMRPGRFDTDFWVTSSGYGYFFAFEYYDQAGETNLGLFPDGTYTFTVTFPDGTTATTSAVLGGVFPGVPTFLSPTCGATGVSRGPTIQFTATGAARFELRVSNGSGGGDNMWRYRGTATTVTVPSKLLLPSTSQTIHIDAYAASATLARKSTSVDNHITTLP